MTTFRSAVALDRWFRFTDEGRAFLARAAARTNRLSEAQCSSPKFSPKGRRRLPAPHSLIFSGNDNSSTR